jgi:HD-like signal output (HDOD) protein
MDLKQLRMVEAENAILGVNHAEIGYYLAGRWNLPEVLRAAIGFHHNPVEGMNNSRIAGLVAMADRMARELGIGSGGGCNPEVEPEVFELCRLDAEMYEAMRAELQGEMEAQVGTLVNMG